MNDKRSQIAAPGNTGRNEKIKELALKKLASLVALAMVLIGALAVALGLTACEPDDSSDSPDYEWYLSGTWANNNYPDEMLTFYDNGSGYWQSLSSGQYLDFDYYCYGNNIYFTMYPYGASSYELNCTIYMRNSSLITVVWPAGSFYGPTAINYSRVI